jgi:indole-3-acetate monooxygenase
MPMNAIGHPEGFIPVETADLIRKWSAEAEQSGSLHPEQLRVIHAKKWFNLFVPAAYGGLETDLPDGLRIEEGLACCDGSTGWVVTLCSGAGWFSGFLEKELARDIFKNEKACFAGSGYPGGRAIPTREGYEVSGSWDYATGAPHATVFTANCVIGGSPGRPPKAGGEEEISPFLFFREEIHIRENWNAMGMIATASHGFELKQSKLAANRCFAIERSKAVLPGILYRYPFLQFAEATLAVNLSGMAIRFMDLSEPNDRQPLQKAKTDLEELRESFYAAVQRSWDTVAGGNIIPPTLLQEVSNACRSLAAGARKAVDAIYPLCGLKAANRSSEINRVWRNLHTAGQHPLLTDG